MYEINGDYCVECGDYLTDDEHENGVCSDCIDAHPEELFDVSTYDLR